MLIADEDKTTEYGNRQVTFNVQLWPWELIKGPNDEETGKFRDDWLTAMFKNATNAEVDVKINKHKSQEGVYMIQDLYGWSFLTECFEATQDEIEEGAGLTFKSANIVIDASDPNAVVIDQQFSGINDAAPGYGDYYIRSEQPGTLVDGIITFPKNGLALLCDRGGMYANTKRFVKAFSRSLRIECRGTGVSVTTAFFGAVDTPLYPLKPSLRRLAVRLAVMIPPEKAVRKALKAMFRRRRKLMPGLINHIFLPIIATLPDFILSPVYGLVRKRMGNL